MPEQIADTIDRFIKLMADYFRAVQLFNLEASFIDNPLVDKKNRRVMDQFGKTLLEHDGQKHEARSKFVPLGRTLAEHLEAIGEDSTLLFKLLHAADGGGGPSAVSPLWPDVKASLQRVAIRCRLGLYDIRVGNNSNTKSQSAQKAVVKYIAIQEAAGVDLLTLTRDGIANAVNKAPVTVSGTKAWKELATKKTARPCNTPDAAVDAIHRRDWKAFGRIQAKEAQEQRQHRE